MKSGRIIAFVGVVLFLCACPAFALIEFKDGESHALFGVINEDVWVDFQSPGMYTKLDIPLGTRIKSPYKLEGFRQSWIGIYGGSIEEEVVAHDSTQLNIGAGSIGTVSAHDGSRVNISGGSIQYLISIGSSQVNVSGGEIEDLYSDGSSQVDISGGSIYGLESYASSQVNLSGGSIDCNIYSCDSSKIDISGGSIGGYLTLDNQGKIQIFGSNFAVDGQPFGYGELTSIFGGWCSNEPLRHLTGTLLSGEFIDNDFRIGSTARIVLTIPEPASAAIMAIGGFFLALRRRRC